MVYTSWKWDTAKIILPPFLAIMLFIILAFWIVLPAFRENLLDQKKEMLLELTKTAEHILAYHYQQEIAGTLTKAQAQKQAIAQIRTIRYGHDGKDYFWINDLEGVMLMHPYRPDLEGKNVITMRDQQGKRLIAEFVATVRDNGQGFVSYMWPHDEDKNNVIAKLSYVKGFAPWGWILGTGVYLEDVDRTIAITIRGMTGATLIILFLSLLLSLYMVQKGLSIAEQREEALAELKRHHDRLEEIVEERTARLTESNRDLQHFAHMASHDLREPLLLIQAFGRRLAKKYGSLLDTKGQEYLLRFEVLTDRMSRLLERMLLYSRVAIRPNLTTPADLTTIAREVIADLQMRIENTGGRVDLEDLGIIEADQLQMHQLLQNLIGNALKYHRPDVPPVVKITSRLILDDTDSPFRNIIIEDNGIGFDESESSRLFEIFHRHQTNGQYEGTGVGLAICKRIVERHNGIIVATGKPDDGAQFIIWLPVKQPGSQITDHTRHKYS